MDSNIFTANQFFDQSISVYFGFVFIKQNKRIKEGDKQHAANKRRTNLNEDVQCLKVTECYLNYQTDSMIATHALEMSFTFPRLLDAAILLNLSKWNTCKILHETVCLDATTFCLQIIKSISQHMSHSSGI